MDDLARQLPDPPPPRPAARSSAIAAALARFDSEGAPSVAVPPPARSWIGRRPVGVLVSAVLVAVVGIPLALRQASDPAVTPHVHEVAQPAALDSASPGETKAVQRAPQSLATSPVPSRPDAEARQREPASTTQADVPAAVAKSSLALAPPPPVVAPPPPPAPAPPPPPVAMASAPEVRMAAPAAMARVADSAREEIVVTGSRVSRGRVSAIRHGDWNACTVDDPARALRGCGGALRTGAKGSAEEAAGYLSNGLTLAWRRNEDAAIAAFDAAIALQPKLGLAYLNRGLVRWHSGAADLAAADFDRAIRYDPSARNYHARARFRRDRGDVRGADADDARAVEIDPRYADIIDE